MIVLFLLFVTVKTLKNALFGKRATLGIDLFPRLGHFALNLSSSILIRAKKLPTRDSFPFSMAARFSRNLTRWGSPLSPMHQLQRRLETLSFLLLCKGAKGSRMPDLSLWRRAVALRLWPLSVFGSARGSPTQGLNGSRHIARGWSPWILASAHGWMTRWSSA